MIVATAAQRRALLDRSQTIAIVGASNNPNRASYFVFSYLRTRTRFTIVAINPMLPEIDGLPSYRSLAAYAEQHGAPDIVDVFRRPSELLAVTQEAIAIGAKAIWYQYQLIDAEAIALADQAGLDVVIDRCLKVETARFNGGLSIGGLDSGVITSKRRQAHRR
jgi:predicted CoA-binding protein